MLLTGRNLGIKLPVAYETINSIQKDLNFLPILVLLIHALLVIVLFEGVQKNASVVFLHLLWSSALVPKCCSLVVRASTFGRNRTGPLFVSSETPGLLVRL